MKKTPPENIGKILKRKKQPHIELSPMELTDIEQLHSEIKTCLFVWETARWLLGWSAERAESADPKKERTAFFWPESEQGFLDVS